jgi:hypothetical protein
MAGWTDDLAAALAEEPLSPQEVETLLEVARGVAHRVERKVTPLSTFLLGVAVGRRMAAGEGRSTATDAALADLRAILPAPPDA